MLSAFRAPPRSEWGTRAALCCPEWVARQGLSCAPHIEALVDFGLGAQGGAGLGAEEAILIPGPSPTCCDLRWWQPRQMSAAR